MDVYPGCTTDPSLACGAARWEGRHRCRCGYRKTICDQHEHLCMCGSTWFDRRGCQCKTPREKETPVTNPIETVPVKVTVSVEWDGKVRNQCMYVQPLSPAALAAVNTSSAVREMLRYAAASVAEAYQMPPSPFSDSLFAERAPEPKRSCCARPEQDEDDPRDYDGQY